MRPTVFDFFPIDQKEAVFSKNSGKNLINIVGEEAFYSTVLGVLQGHNLREQTEFLTRARVTIVALSIWKMFFDIQKCRKSDADFTVSILNDAIYVLSNKKYFDKQTVWLAMWALGLNEKAFSNILRNDKDKLDSYRDRLLEVLVDSVRKIDAKNAHSISLSYIDCDGSKNAWLDLAMINTLIGNSALAIRGSDKSTYGKLFEKLILGSVLELLGFQLIRKQDVDIQKDINVFWMSDSSMEREADATLLYKKNSLIRFDIGFIGQGNSEITKDKLTRFASHYNDGKGTVFNKTIVIVDKIPDTEKTNNSANRADANIIQMSYVLWVRSLALQIKNITGKDFEILNKNMSDSDVLLWVKNRLKNVNLMSFL